MHLPPIHTISTVDFFVSGDVTIDESAVVAPGVILQAALDSRIIVGAGACVGMGVILNAYQGDIEIKAGAILGAGVLIIGHGEIGQNACIGATTTIFNTSVEPMTVIPAGSLIGEPAAPQGRLNGSDKSMSEAFPDPFLADEAAVVPENQPTTGKTEAKKASENQPPVVGQVYLNQLLLTLFPERRHFPNNSTPNHQPTKKE